METEAERGAGGGGAKTPPQLRGGRKESGAVTGVVEGRTVEYGKADGESRRGAGDDAAEGWIEPHTGDEGAAEAERVGVNKADKRGTDAAEGRGTDVGKRLAGESGMGAHGAGGGKGEDEMGRGSPNAIVG